MNSIDGTQYCKNNMHRLRNMFPKNKNQVSLYPFVLHEISILIELTLGQIVGEFNFVKIIRTN
jgi:hypothetical protein